MKILAAFALALASFATVACSSAKPTPTGETPRATPPNIVFIMTDDQGYGDLACHGHPFLQTPNLDRLYAQSTRFTDYHASPTCAPTRAALMSGKMPFEVGVTHTILERERMALGVATIAEVLKGAGYETAISGKWHLGEADAYQPGARGFDEVFIHGAGGIGQNYQGSQGDAPGTNYFDPIIRHNGSFVQTHDFCTDVFFQHALGWIKERKDSGKPFFVYIPTNAPHAPFLAPKKYLDLYRPHVKNKKQRAFFGMIHNIDENVGLVMDKLEEWGLADNTLLVFTTDNGTALGAKIYNAGMKGGKGTPHEGGARVPLFVRLPGVTTPGRDIDRLARHLDLFPTLAQLAGADVQGLGLEGRSLLPLIENPQAPWPDRMTYFHGGRWPREGARGQFGQGDTNIDNYTYANSAVRNETWRLVNGEALYHVQSDPGEKHNVIDKHPEIAAEMRAYLEARWQAARPLMVNEDAPLDVEKPFRVQFEKQKAQGGIPEWEAPDL